MLTKAIMTGISILVIVGLWTLEKILIGRRKMKLEEVKAKIASYEAALAEVRRLEEALNAAKIAAAAEENTLRTQGIEP